MHGDQEKRAVQFPLEKLRRATGRHGCLTIQRLCTSTSHRHKLDCLEYIIVHEMVHLLERHHNERFIAYMNRFMPLWQFYREELNQAPLGHESWEY